MAHFYDRESLEEEIFGAGQEDPVPGEDPESRGAGGEAGSEAYGPGEMAGQAAPLELTLTLEDGTSLACRGLAVFLQGEGEYMALETEEGALLIMELRQGEEDSIALSPISEEEREAAYEAFLALYNTEEKGEYDDGDQDREKD